MLWNTGQVRALGKELADQAVGVLIRAAMPGTVRPRKEDLQRSLDRESLVFGELLAVVQRQGLCDCSRGSCSCDARLEPHGSGPTIVILNRGIWLVKRPPQGKGKGDILVFSWGGSLGQNSGVPMTARASVCGVCFHALDRGNACRPVFHKGEEFAAFAAMLGEARERLPMRSLA